MVCELIIFVSHYFVCVNYGVNVSFLEFDHLSDCDLNIEAVVLITWHTYA